MSTLFYKHIKPEATTDYTMVFLHEGLGCTEMFKDFPKQLCNELNCKGFIYDRAGYGQSTGSLENRPINYLEKAADELHKVIKTHITGKIILFGHSDGGSIALVYAAKHPKLVKAIITEAAHVFVEDVTISGIKEAVIAFKQQKLAGLQRFHGKRYAQVFWAWADTWLHPDFKQWQITHLLNLVTCPQLIIQGVNDQYGTMQQVNYIEKLTQGNSFLFKPECGHSPHYEVPTLVLKECRIFVKSKL